MWRLPVLYHIQCLIKSPILTIAISLSYTTAYVSTYFSLAMFLYSTTIFVSSSQMSKTAFNLIILVLFEEFFNHIIIWQNLFSICSIHFWYNLHNMISMKFYLSPGNKFTYADRRVIVKHWNIWNSTMLNGRMQPKINLAFFLYFHSPRLHIQLWFFMLILLILG